MLILKIIQILALQLQMFLRGDVTTTYPEDTKPQSLEKAYPVQAEPAIVEETTEEEEETAQVDKVSLFG